MYGLFANGKENHMLKGLPLHLKTFGIPIQVVWVLTMQNPFFQVAVPPPGM